MRITSGTRVKWGPYWELNNSVIANLTTSCISEYVKRVIVHPAFKNISFKDAERLLAEMDQGECIVRPSSKVNYLVAINWTQW